MQSNYVYNCILNSEHYTYIIYLGIIQCWTNKRDKIENTNDQTRFLHIIIDVYSLSSLYFSSFRLYAALNNEGFFICNFIANIIASIKYIH